MIDYWLILVILLMAIGFAVLANCGGQPPTKEQRLYDLYRPALEMPKF